MDNFPHLPTLLSVAAAVVLLVFVLNRWLFGPLNAILDERRGKIDRARAEFEEAQRLQAERIAEVENRLAAVRREAYAIREQAVRNGRERREELLKQAHADAAAQLQQAKSEIASEVEAARSRLGADAKALSEQIAEHLLGRPLRARGDR